MSPEVVLDAFIQANFADLWKVLKKAAAATMTTAKRRVFGSKTL
jgi:hypothetical protein